MERIGVKPRSNWKEIAEKNGFYFHHINGDLYWDESAYYSFSLKEIETNLETVAQEIHEMCLDLVVESCRNEELMKQLLIPEKYWEFISNSWKNDDHSIYLLQSTLRY